MAIYSGTSSNDSITGSQDDDLIHRLSGRDTVFGGAGNDLIDLELTEWDWAGDSIDGGAGNDTIHGSGGVDTIIGGDGNDEIYLCQEIGPDHNNIGDSDGNVIDGGKGNDTIHSSFLTSTLYFRKGDGQDIVDAPYWWSALNTLEFKDGTKSTDLTIRHNGNDLVVAIKGTTDQVTFKDFYATSILLDHITFQDGTSLDLEQILKSAADKISLGSGSNDTLTGNSNFEYINGAEGNDQLTASPDQIGQVLVGGAGDDTLDGGSSKSFLIGGSGDDTYFISGNQIIQENSGEGKDTAIFSGYYASIPENIEIGILADSPISTYLSDNSLNNFLEGNQYENNLTAISGNDTLWGHAGPDTLTAWGGNDTYIFSIGDGQDVLVANDTAQSRPNTLQIIGSHDLPSQINGERVGDSLVLSIIDTLDTITLKGFFTNGTIYNPFNPVQQVYFPESGVTWNLDTLAMLVGKNDVFGSDEDDVLLGTTGIDRLYGFAGNDTLSGGAGADQMEGGSGDDTYFVDDADDLVQENQDEGNDLVVASVSYTAPINVEDIALTGEALQATGNALANKLTGNEWDNRLEGLDGNDTLTNYWGGIDTLVGGNGDDLYVVNNPDTVVEEFAGEGYDWIQSYINYTASANVEGIMLIGTNHADIVGNTLNNSLYGNKGNNRLTGGAGNDTYWFRSGDGQDTITSETDARADRVETLILDGLLPRQFSLRLQGSSLVLTINDSSDSVTIEGFLSNGAVNTTTCSIQTVKFRGSDIVMALSDWAAPLLSNTVTGDAGNNVLNGTAGADRLYGLAGNDTLIGNAGNDTLDGGTGTDKMSGGAGNDLYLVDIASDTVTENLNEGTDLIRADVSYTAPANVENLTLTGTANLNATGNALANVLTGNAGNNALDGAVGADTLIGGAGNDTYTVDVAGDIVKEEADQGTDTILSAVSYTVSANVENLTLTGSANTNATGNALTNTLMGNGGNNVLDGGTGNDTLIGGKGNDTYIVDSSGDVVTEGVGMGIDLIVSSITYSASANVENLTLTGSTAVNATGNALVNVLTGNDGDNVLDGGGGADKLIGGSGNDTYVVDIVGDTITEAAGQGIDLILSAVAYTASANVENLTLTGSAAIKGTGNALDNVLTGNSGANTLDGAAGNDSVDGGSGNDTLIGGVGADLLTGGAGSDLFVFTAGSTVLTITGRGDAGLLTGHDRISDFALGFLTGAQDKVDTIGTPTIVANTSASGVNGKDSALTLAGQTVKSHAISNGMVTFDDADTYATALSLTSMSDVAAVVQYLQGNNLGKAGASVAFDADTGGVHHTFLFTQGDATGTNNTLDVLVDLVGVDASRLATIATAGMSTGTLMIG